MWPFIVSLTVFLSFRAMLPALMGVCWTYSIPPWGTAAALYVRRLAAKKCVQDGIRREGLDGSGGVVYDRFRSDKTDRPARLNPNMRGERGSQMATTKQLSEQMAAMMQLIQAQQEQILALTTAATAAPTRKVKKQVDPGDDTLKAVELPGTRPNSFQLQFPSKPGPTIRDKMKNASMLYNPGTQLWYGKLVNRHLVADLIEGQAPTPSRTVTIGSSAGAPRKRRAK